MASMHSKTRLQRSTCAGAALAPVKLGRCVAPVASRPEASGWVAAAGAERSASSSVTTKKTREEMLVSESTIRDFTTSFSSLLSEYEYWVDDAWVEGNIPVELEGTYFRNGPGLQISNPRYQRHTFDGDGMIFSLAFKDGQAFFRNKFVCTKGFVDEQAAGKPIYRNAFSKGSADGSPFFNPFDLSFKNVANTGVLHWGDKLYALWEGGKPHELDPRTLETIGESNVGGVLGAAASMAGHYRIFTEQDGSERWVTFGMSNGLNGASVQFYELAEGGRCVARSEHVLEGVDMSLVHDMIVTENYYVLVLGSIQFDVQRFATEYLLGRCSVAQCLKYNKDVTSKVMMFPRTNRPSAAGLRTVVADCPRPFFPFHHVNAYEEASTGQVVIDTIAWQEISFDMNQFTMNADHYIGGARSEYFRLVVDPASRKVVEQRRILDAQTVEFPTLAPAVTGRRHSHVYFIGDTVRDEVMWGPAQALIKVNLPGKGDVGSSLGTSMQLAMGSVKAESWQAGPRCFVGEPMFVPRPKGTSEDDGWIILGAHNAETMKGEVYILDAKKISEGPVATLHLPHQLPASLHGSFSSEYLGPDPKDNSVPRWREVAKIRAL